MQDSAKASTNKMSSRRKPLIVVALLTTFAALAFIGGWYGYAHRYIPGKITFQQYEPKYWPASATIKEKTIEAKYVPSGSPARYTELVIEMSDGSTISESERSHQSLTYQCPPSKIINQSCKLGHTNQGGPYLLFTSTFESGTIDQLIEWSRGGTNITINLDKTPKNDYTEEEIEKIIESFEAVKYENLKVRYIDKSVI